MKKNFKLRKTKHGWNIWNRFQQVTAFVCDPKFGNRDVAEWVRDALEAAAEREYKHISKADRELFERKVRAHDRRVQKLAGSQA